MIKAEIIDQEVLDTCVMDNYQENLQLRNQQYEESKQQNNYDDEDEDEEYHVPDPTKEPTTRAVRQFQP